MDTQQHGDLDPFAAALEALDELEGSRVDYASDPYKWATERAGFDVWSKQREVMESVRDHRRTAVHACHAVGKSFVAAIIAAWFIDSHPPGEAFVLSTAPSAPQVRAILWRNINRVHAKAGLPGRCNQTEWFIPTGEESEELVAIGRKPSEHDEATFQGIHARYVLVILDEASGVPQALWNATETIASNENARILAIGNPDLTSGPFADACRNITGGWNPIHIGYEHSPAATGEAVSDEMKESLISAEWAEDRRIAWGEDSALYQAKVQGVFPAGNTDPWRVMDEQAVSACRFLDPENTGFHEVGIDVGGGGDRTVIVERIGNAIGRIESLNTPDPMQAVGQLAALIREWKVTTVKIDVIGIGWGVAGRLREVLKPEGVRVVGVNFAGKSRQPHKFVNMRAEAWWHGRELSRDGAWSLAALSDDDVAELVTPRYEIVDSSGKIKIELKDHVRDRLGRSPDVADAVLLAFHDVMSVQGETVTGVLAFQQASLTSGVSGLSVFGNATFSNL